MAQSKRKRGWLLWVPIAVAGAIAVVLGVVALATLAPTAPMPVPTTSSSATAQPKGDGVLTIGTLLPTTGEGAARSKAQQAGVELAVRELNEAGGVNGVPVVVFHQDSGDGTSTKAEDAFAFLAGKSIDVVIGPSTPNVLEHVLPEAMSTGTVMISPAIPGSAISALDGDGLLFGMTPSSALEGQALAGMLGAERVAIVYYSDAAGEAIHDELAAAVQRDGGELVASEKFAETINGVNRILATLTAAAPDAVVLASPPAAIEKTKAIILGLTEAGLGGDRLWLSSRNLAAGSLGLPAGTLEGVNGLLQGAAPDAGFQARVHSADPSVSDYRFAAEAYDATILAALAATVAGEDTGRAVAGELRAASGAGIACSSFGECLEVLKTRDDIDYNGVSGQVDFDERGVARAAIFGHCVFGADNTCTRTAAAQAD